MSKGSVPRPFSVSRSDFDRNWAKTFQAVAKKRTVAPKKQHERSWLPSGLLIHHNQADCAGEHCCIHNPSDHKMRDWPLHWRADRGLMERICPHGVGHPDPDDIAHKRRLYGDDYADAAAVHGCDGCCRG